MSWILKEIQNVKKRLKTWAAARWMRKLGEREGGAGNLYNAVQVFFYFRYKHKHKYKHKYNYKHKHRQPVYSEQHNAICLVQCNGATQIILENHCNCKSTAVHPTIKVHWAVYTVASFSLSSNCISQQSRAGGGKWKLNCSALQSTDLSCILQSALQAFISKQQQQQWQWKGRNTDGQELSRQAGSGRHKHTAHTHTRPLLRQEIHMLVLKSNVRRIHRSDLFTLSMFN